MPNEQFQLNLNRAEITVVIAGLKRIKRSKPSGKPQQIAKDLLSRLNPIVNPGPVWGEPEADE